MEIVHATDENFNELINEKLSIISRTFSTKKISHMLHKNE